MKLIFCTACQDVLKLLDEKRQCACGKSWGHYTGDVKAVIGGEAIPLGIANSSFAAAIRARPREGLGRRFEAFVIPKKCPTVKAVEEEP